MISTKRPVATSRRTFSALTLVALSMSLGGCLTHVRDNNNALASIPADYRERHPIVVEEANRSIEVFVGSERGGLSASQRADVIGFGRSWMREGTGRMLIEVPRQTPNARPAADSYHEIRSLLSAVGVPPRAVVERDYHPIDERQFATIHMTYPRIAAEAGPCGLWPDDLGPSIKNKIYIENKPYHNFGCASQRNLAAMVANPSDLVQPRSDDNSALAAQRSAMMEHYRKGENTAATYPSVDKAKLSDLGK